MSQKKEKSESEVNTITNNSISKKQSKTNEMVFKKFLISILIFLIILFVGWFLISLTNVFNYKDVKYTIIKEKGVTFYHTVFPGYFENKPVEINLYLRNDPRFLDKTIPFQGDLILNKLAVINLTGDFSCSGDGVISVANLNQIYNFMGITLIKDPNATCDNSSRYTFIRLIESNETKIEEFSPSCFNIHINNCEVLPATERFLLESFYEYKKLNEF